MKRKLLSMLVLLMTVATGAWADGKVYTSAVDITALQVGDILAEGASINGSGLIIFDINRVKWNGTLWTDGTMYLNTSDFDSFGAEGVISLSNNSTLSPVDKDNNDGNAWEVTNVENNNYIHIQGITYTPATDGDGAFTLSVGTSEHGTVTFKVGENTVTTAQEGQTVTVEITPATGWVVNQPSGQWYAAVAASRSQRAASVDLLDKVTLTPVEGQTNQWTFTMARANVEISSTYKKLLTNTDITIQDITAPTYTGVAQTPTVVVKDGETTLVKDVDYTVAYSNNIAAALSTATTAPTVTITAVATSEKYAGTATKTFTINKKALTVTAENKSVTFGDEAPAYTVTYDGFVNNETNAVLGGTLSYACNYVKNQTAAGTYDITPSGLTSDNYAITFTKGTLTVGKKALENSFIADIQSLVYNGLAQEPAPVVTFNGMTLVKTTDYTVAYANNTNVGTATVTVTAAAASTKYSGQAQKTFAITKKALTVTAENKSVTFGDEAPAFTVSYNGFAAQENKDVLGGTLSYACNYVKNQTAAGTYDITPSGLTSDNYAINFTKGTLTVGKKALENDFIAAIDALIYTSEAQEPAPVVTFNGMTLEKDADYTVVYANNVNVGTATVTVSAAAASTKYSGTAQKTFVINPAALTGMKLAKTEFIYNAFDPQPQTAEVAEVKAGELVVPAAQYTVEGNTKTDLGEYTVTVTGNTNFTGTATTTFAIVKDDLPVKAEDTENGEEVDNVTIQVSVETDSQTGEKTVIVDQLDVNPASASQQVTVEIPSQINGVNVGSIAAGALGSATNVSDIYMPETGETAIEVSDNALETSDGKATVHAPIQLLDNYAKMLPGHVGEKKVVSEVTQTAKRFWSFSCGVDVELPAGVTANIVKANSESQVTSEPIKENVVKANNGVLLEGEQGVEYQLTALPATSVGNDYAGNLLEPVIEKKHLGYGQGYYILKDGKFYAIANDADEIPSCKAVLHIAGANARVIDLVFGDATKITTTDFTDYTDGVFYDLNGRKIVTPTRKGIYILNGKKVVVR